MGSVVSDLSRGKGPFGSHNISVRDPIPPRMARDRELFRHDRGRERFDRGGGRDYNRRMKDFSKERKPSPIHHPYDFKVCWLLWAEPDCHLVERRRAQRSATRYSSKASPLCYQRCEDARATTTATDSETSSGRGLYRESPTSAVCHL